MCAVRRFGVACGGSSIVEFALVVPPFLLMMMGILEISMVLFVSVHLEGSVHEAARQIRTGNVQNAASPIGEFRTILCGRLEVVLDCDGRLVIDVRPFNQFNSITFAPFYDENGEAQGNGFSPGTAGEIVLVRVAYNWNITTPLLGKLLADDGVSRKVILAAAAFRNEPFNGAP
jgi:Flp pilus assembly protein TadG